MFSSWIWTSYKFVFWSWLVLTNSNKVGLFSNSTKSTIRRLIEGGDFLCCLKWVWNTSFFQTLFGFPITKEKMFILLKNQKQIKKKEIGNYLAVQVLGLDVFIAMVRVQSLVGEWRSHKPRGAAKKYVIKRMKQCHLQQHV